MSEKSIQSTYDKEIGLSYPVGLIRNYTFPYQWKIGCRPRRPHKIVGGEAMGRVMVLAKPEGGTVTATVLKEPDKGSNSN